MMLFIYNAGIRIFRCAISVAALFNTKARFWIKGRKKIFERMKKDISPLDRIIWFHAASLGEFEQGRPLIEKIKSKYRDYKILLTFFSPSGYEIRKNYKPADFVYYLPLDTKKNARLFISIVNPAYSFFIKYEYWYHYLHELKQKGKNIYLISAIFREEQVFFKWYGKWFTGMLDMFDEIFIQDIHSLELLKRIGISRVTLAGDTRFDRVAEIAKSAKVILPAKKFTRAQKCIVAGSTWPPDEEMLIKYIKQSSDVKMILAPHEIDASHIFKIEKRLDTGFLRFSQITESDIFEEDVLIIDNIGMLSSLYSYGKIAYIGGGFGAGIHNILEAATFGIPVVFGPNFQKFKEARDLVEMKAAFTVSGFNDLKKILDKLLTNDKFYLEAARKTKQYVEDNLGATELIMKKVLGK
jgi:3-deoxy-D-manno-octulosonic-acid transferase